MNSSRFAAETMVMAGSGARSSVCLAAKPWAGASRVAYPVQTHITGNDDVLRPKGHLGDSTG